MAEVIFSKKNSSKLPRCGIVWTILIGLIFGQLTFCYVEEPGKWNKWRSDKIIVITRAITLILKCMKPSWEKKKREISWWQLSRWPFPLAFLINNIMGQRACLLQNEQIKNITHLTQPIELFILITNVNTMSFKLTIVMIL